MNETGSARRRQLLAAVSILGVSLGMAAPAAAADEQPATGWGQSSQKGDQGSLKIDHGGTQSSLKVQGSYKEQGSIKGEQGSLKIEGQGTQNSYKEQSAIKLQNSYKEQGALKGESTQGTANQVKSPSGYH